jgi:NitT/TauT family transport system substrate-binding protein
VIGNDQANLSPGTSFSILSTAKGRPMVTIAAMNTQTAVDLVVSNAVLAKANVRPTDPFADRIKALRGLKLGISSIGSGTDSVIRYVLPHYGLRPDTDVTLITLGSCVAMLAALQSGNVDGFLCAPPAPQQAEANGLGKVLFSGTSGEIPDVRDALYLGYFAKPDYVKKNPATIQAFVNGLTKGLRFVHAHPDEAATIAAKYQPGLEPALFDKTFKLFLHAFPKTAVTDVESMRRIIDVVKATSPDLPAVDANKLVDNSFAERAATNIK